MYCLSTKGFLRELKTYKKPKIIDDFAKFYGKCSGKKISEFALMKPEELTEILNFFVEYEEFEKTNDLFWDRAYAFPDRLKEIPPKKRERRLF